jgi:hypothetical protein
MKTIISICVVFLWGVAPQIACFMPDQALTQPEMDCCKEMVTDCGNPSMNHSCCRTVVRTDIGITAEASRFIPRMDSTTNTLTIFASVLPIGFSETFIHESHAPPPEFGVPFQVLRI